MTYTTEILVIINARRPAAALGHRALARRVLVRARWRSLALVRFICDGWPLSCRATRRWAVPGAPARARVYSLPRRKAGVHRDLRGPHGPRARDPRGPRAESAHRARCAPAGAPPP